MSTHNCVAAPKMRPITNFDALALRTIAVVAAAALAAGCAADPSSRVAGSDPSDPRVPVPVASYRSTIAPYESLRPVDPLPWPQQNQQVAPSPKR